VLANLALISVLFLQALSAKKPGNFSTPKPVFRTKTALISALRMGFIRQQAKIERRAILPIAATPSFACNTRLLSCRAAKLSISA